ncbi:MAG: polysaccharide biosynthesis tyrosine autokinase [Sphingobacterium sp.]|jgi:capsular exopolysaccharide synthesis family protein|nr:polysaccharide biosynthesis tyrosine autokinase [Sphingobacterium sp.]
MKKINDWEDELTFEDTKSDNRDLIQFIRRIYSNWYWFALCALVGLSLAYLYLRYTNPTYTIKAKLLVSDDKKGGMVEPSALLDLSSLMGAKNSVDNEVEVLKTADLFREAVLAEKSYITYFNAGQVHNAPVMLAPIELQLLSSPDSIRDGMSLKALLIDSKTVELSNADTSFRTTYDKDFHLPSVGTVILHKKEYPTVEGMTFGFSVIPIKKAVGSLAESLNIEVTNKNVSTIDLTLNHGIAQRGEQILRTLIQKYIERNLHDKNAVADSTLSFINARLKFVTEELAGVENKISGYKKNARLSDISEQSKILLHTSSEYTKSLAEAETQLAILDDISKYLKDSSNPRIVPASIIPQDISFNTLIPRFNELVLQRERLLLGNTVNNPIIQNIDKQLQGLRADMIANIQNTRQQLDLSRNKQQQRSDLLTNQLSEVPTIERGFIDLTRMQQIKQEQYIFLQQKWEETAISRTANVANAKVIDSPKADEFPIAPKKKLIYVLGLLAGLITPLGIIYLKDLLNVRIRSIEDITSRSNLPVLGAIAHNQSHEQVVITKTSRSPIAEQFRALRTNLEFVLQGGKTILFTSSMSGEGKSYIALNLAVTLALLNKRVVLMELDLRKPTLTSKLSIDAGTGFSHYVVRSEMEIDEIITPSGKHEFVDLIQAGIIPPNPAELLVLQRTADLINSLKDRYDYILIDAPPVGLVTDAQLLNRYADVCLYIIRQDFTFKEQLFIPNDLEKKGKIKPIQFVVNDVQAKGSYQRNYGYGYGYGYGDYGQEEKQPWWKFWNKK